MPMAVPAGGEAEPEGQAINITVNISGNILQDDWIETELSEKVSDAIRRGVVFGDIG